MWQQWVNFILALWLILSGYLGFEGGTMATNLTIVGIIMAVLALWGALGHRRYHINYEAEHRHA